MYFYLLMTYLFSEKSDVDLIALIIQMYRKSVTAPLRIQTCCEGFYSDVLSVDKKIKKHKNLLIVIYFY